MNSIKESVLEDLNAESVKFSEQRQGRPGIWRKRVLDSTGNANAGVFPKRFCTKTLMVRGPTKSIQLLAGILLADKFVFNPSMHIPEKIKFICLQIGRKPKVYKLGAAKRPAIGYFAKCGYFDQSVCRYFFWDVYVWIRKIVCQRLSLFLVPYWWN